MADNTPRVVVTAKVKGALSKDVCGIYGTPSKKLKASLPTKNAQAFAIGHILADMGLHQDAWASYINVTGLLSSNNAYGVVTDVLSIDTKGGTVKVKPKAQPYCEAHHHHVFLPKKAIGKGYGKAVTKTVDYLGGDGGKELVAVLNAMVPKEGRKRAACISRVRKALPKWQARLKK
jgi:hypothetical protein